MASPLTAHPSSDQLQAFVLGTLSLSEVTAVEEHLADCLECQRSLEQVANSKDPFVRQLEQAGALAQRLTPSPRDSEGTIVLPAKAAPASSPPIGSKSSSEIDIEALRFRVDLMSGVGPSIEERLLSFAEGSRPDLLRRLLIVEMEECLRANLPVPVDDYLQRFPDTSVVEQAYEQAMSRLARESAAEQHLMQLFPKPFDAVGRFREYLYQSKIGEGGMGAVYKALHTRLERPVAFKVLSPDKVQSPEMIARFHREMKSVGKLEHPNIVRAHDAGDHAGCHFLVMEFVDGVPLDVLLKRRGPLPVREACEVIRQAAIGLDYAHRHGLVHRDVKPSNMMIAGVGAKRPAVPQTATTAQSASQPPSPSVPAQTRPLIQATVKPTGPTQDRPALPDTDSMIHHTMETLVVPTDDKSAEAKTVTAVRSSCEFRDPPNEPADPAKSPTPLSMREMTPTVKVLDLGLARLQSEGHELTHESQVVGTLDYIAPEQARRGGNVDHRADIYSLGCTLFTLLAGRAPYGDASHASIVQKVMAHVEEPLPSLSEIRPDVPPPVVEILRRMTAKQPAQRFQSASAVAEVLAPHAQGANLRSLNDAGQTAITTPISLGSSHAPLATGTTILLPGQPARRRGVLSGLTALLILLAAGVWWSNHSPKTTHNSGLTDPNTNKPTMVSDKSLADDPNVSPMALHFDGVDDYVALPEIKIDGQPYDRRGPITFEAWLTSDIDNSRIGENDAMSVWTNEGWMVKLSRLGWQHWRCFTSSQAEHQRGQRTHVAAVWEGTRTRVFVNGVAGPTFGEDDGGKGDLPRTLGCRGQFWDGTPINEFFQGSIDEVRISKGVRYVEKFSPVERFDADPSTLALYRFEEGTGDQLADASGHGHHGKIVGATWGKLDLAPKRNMPPRVTTPAAELEDFALQFEPATLVEVESLTLDPTGPHTQEAWVTPTISEIKYPIHVFGRPQGSSLFLDNASGGWAFGLSLDDGFRHVASKPIERDQRSHVAVVRANREMRLFVNGKLASRRNESGQPLMSPPKPYLIGYQFTGVMDEIHVSSLARYEQDFTPKARCEPDAHTLALFHCDEGSGVVLKDSSGNDRHGQIKAPASWTLHKK